MNPSPFSSYLAGLPADLAAELEDHLMECYEARLRSGLSPDQASKAALQSLGAPSQTARRCLKESALRGPHRVPLILPQRIAILGWLLLGIGFASRVCVASDPSHGSIAACVGLSAGALAMALVLRRAWVSDQVGIALSLGLTLVAGVALLQASWHLWIQDSLALTPADLVFLALFGALSGGALTAYPRRNLGSA